MAHLQPNQIRFLALEGGGGKGFAYLGAIEVLEKLNVLDHVEGYAGASAGAISALLLSIGYNHADLSSFVSTTNFDDWWESSSPRLIPEVGKAYSVKKDSITERGVKATGSIIALTTAITILIRAIGFFKPSVATMSGRNPVKALLSGLEDRVLYLQNDMGLFPGQKPRDEFDSVINARAVVAAKRRGVSHLLTKSEPMTFSKHLQVFGKRLVVTGANLSTGLTELFSATTTPDFPVADAIRISMGLPYIFKPYVINRTTPGKLPPCGTYVDGGLFNNLPFREQEGETAHATNTSPPRPGTAPLPGLGATASTLLLRLDEFKPLKILSFTEIILKVLENGFTGTGKSQILSRFREQAIVLDTFPLELVEFKPSTATQIAINKRSRRTTYRYFNISVPSGDLDAADDADVSKRLAKSAQGACF